MNFSGKLKAEIRRILPEKLAILRVKKLKTLFLPKVSGGKSISGGSSPTPCPTEKTLKSTLDLSSVPSTRAQNCSTMSKNVKIPQIYSFALSALEHVSFVKANATLKV